MSKDMNDIKFILFLILVIFGLIQISIHFNVHSIKEECKNFKLIEVQK